MIFVHPHGTLSVLWRMPQILDGRLEALCAGWCLDGGIMLALQASMPKNGQQDRLRVSCTSTCWARWSCRGVLRVLVTLVCCIAKAIVGLHLQTHGALLKDAVTSATNQASRSAAATRGTRSPHAALHSDTQGVEWGHHAQASRRACAMTSSTPSTPCACNSSASAATCAIHTSAHLHPTMQHCVPRTDTSSCCAECQRTGA